MLYHKIRRGGREGVGLLKEEIAHVAVFVVFYFSLTNITIQNMTYDATNHKC